MSDVEAHGAEVREALRPRFNYWVRLSRGLWRWDHAIRASGPVEASMLAIAERGGTGLKIVSVTRNGP